MDQFFFSHSGSTSKAVADIFYEWFGFQFPFATRWMSNHDIDNGEIWYDEIQNALISTSAYLVFLTSTNKGKPWLIYELAKAEDNGAHIYPILIDICHTDVDVFFRKYQHTTLNKEDVKKLAISLNENLKVKETRMPLENVLEYFNLKWRKLKRDLDKVVIQ